MAFPSTLSAFPRPNPTDLLNSPSHSGLHNTVSSALGQVEAVIGVEGNSSVVGTLMQIVKSPGSQGGGHVQGAAFGGTGQTTFAKGDMFVAQSASVISKLAVGADNTQLVADSSTSVGVKWATPSTTKVQINLTPASVVSNNNELQLFAASILGNTLGTTNAIRFMGALSTFVNRADSFTVRALYGPNSVFTILINNVAGNVVGAQGVIDGMIVANGATNSQKGFGQFRASTSLSEAAGDANVGISKTLGFGYGTSSVNSTTNQELIITADWGGTSSSVVGQFFVVEKIT